MARKLSKSESSVSYAILLVLVIIATGIFLKHLRYNAAILTPTVIRQDNSAKSPSRVPSSLTLAQYAPTGVVPLSQPENFGPENLSDKINGKAELYLSSGFVRLFSQRLSLAEASGAWIEVFVYDMGSSRGSFAVYSMQRRFEAEKIDLGEFAYKTENALFFVHGQYYVEIIASVSEDSVVKLMVSYGKNFVHRTIARKDRISELTSFPSEVTYPGLTSS